MTSPFVKLLSGTNKQPGIQSTLAEVAHGNAPLFTRVPPVWARWAWAFVAADFIFFGNVIDLAWNRWAIEVPTPKVVPEPGKARLEDAQPEKNWELRPAWQRAGVAASFFILGTGMAGALLFARSRVIRSFTFVQPAAGTNAPADRKIFIQTTNNPRDTGMVLPFRHCFLSEGRNVQEMIMQIRGQRGSWDMGLKHAKINGEPATTYQARTAILEAWKGGNLRGKWASSVEADPRWKSGPIVANRRKNLK
ncbi:hypothetical protein BDQ12DRAFT_621735 [Crucibulum laeve]|uniref:Uncharacterized protein n=1 Tax=Crucibulum laeve TaxID=68775 RepID=A0A5C3MIT5_9AGAR|nr:hypothetical protein BDQ12DRAFT_621735 [Crucibulum laeve]